MDAEEHRFMIVVTAAVVVKLLLSSRLSPLRACVTVASGVFCAWAFTDGTLSLSGLQEEIFWKPIAALWALTGEGFMRAVIDFPHGRGALFDLIKLWRGK